MSTKLTLTVETEEHARLLAELLIAQTEREGITIQTAGGSFAVEVHKAGRKA